MKQSITSFLLFGATVGGIVGLIGVGERILSWPINHTLAAIGGLALLGTLVSFFPYLLWSAKNRASKSGEAIEQDVADFPFESPQPSSEGTFDSLRMKLAADREELSKIIKILSKRKRAPYHFVQIHLRSTVEVGKYEFVAQNTGKCDLWNISFDKYELFNIDDTHMPIAVAEHSSVRIAHLPARAEVSFLTITLTEKSPYRPRSNRQVNLAYAFQQDGGESGYEPAYLGIAHNVPTIRSIQQTHPHSYSAFDMPTFERFARYLITLFKKFK